MLNGYMGVSGKRGPTTRTVVYWGLWWVYIEVPCLWKLPYPCVLELYVGLYDKAAEGFGILG